MAPDADQLSAGGLPEDIRSYIPGDVDPAELPPGLERPIGRRASKAIAEYAEDHTRDETAEHFGVSRPTVDRHISAWDDDLDHTGEVKFSDMSTVTERMCSAMRAMAVDSSIVEVAEAFDVSHTTARKHTSATASCQHDGDADVGRVEFQWGDPGNFDYNE